MNWTYLLSVNLVLSVLFIFYSLLLKNQNFFQLNRIYLLGSIPLSFALPLLPNFSTEISTNFIPTSLPKFSPIVTNYSITTSNNTEGLSVSIGEIGTVLYLLITLFFALKIIWGVVRIYQLKIGAVKTTFEGQTCYEVVDPGGFSFFGWIFIGRQDNNSYLKQLIYRHEKVHARQFHSMDVLLSEFTTAIFWWNPFCWKLKTQIKLNHEFIVDHNCSSQLGKQKYAQALTQQVFQTAMPLMANPLNHSKLNKRLAMLNTKPQTRYARLILVLPLLLCCSWFISGQNLSPLSSSYTAPITNPDTLPEYAGGEDKYWEAIHNYHEQNVPPALPGADTVSIIGRKSLGVLFIITETGKVENIRISGNSELPKVFEQHALQFVQNMPNWKPATKDGKPVSVEMSLPFMYGPHAVVFYPTLVKK